MESQRVIKVKARCVVVRDQEILLAKHWDPRHEEWMYRPLGGTVEFGESGQAAACREVLEEIGQEVQVLRFLGVLEDIRMGEDQVVHDIHLMYEAQFVHKASYLIQEFLAHEVDEDFKVYWVPIERVRSNTLNIMPYELPNLIAKMPF